VKFRNDMRVSLEVDVYNWVGMGIVD